METVINLLVFVWGVAVLIGVVCAALFVFGCLAIFADGEKPRKGDLKILGMFLVVCSCTIGSMWIGESIVTDYYVFSKDGEYLETIKSPQIVWQWSLDRRIAGKVLYSDANAGRHSVVIVLSSNLNIDVSYDIVREDFVGLLKIHKTPSGINQVILDAVTNSTSFAQAKNEVLVLYPEMKKSDDSLLKKQIAGIMSKPVLEARAKIAPLGIKVADYSCDYRQ